MAEEEKKKPQKVKVKKKRTDANFYREKVTKAGHVLKSSGPDAFRSYCAGKALRAQDLSHLERKAARAKNRRWVNKDAIAKRRQRASKARRQERLLRKQIRLAEREKQIQQSRQVQ